MSAASSRALFTFTTRLAATTHTSGGHTNAHSLNFDKVIRLSDSRRFQPAAHAPIPMIPATDNASYA